VCWNNLGAALTGRERHQEAEEAYRRVAALRPMSGMIANNIAIALHGQHRDAEAEEMLRLAIRLDPILPGPLINLGAFEAQAGRFSEALPHLRKAYALDPKHFGAVKELAWALVAAAASERKSGHPSEALALYQEALTVQPGNAQARDGLEALSAGRPADGLRR
jgi:tetratricopeptide (TPR) repeat protein